MTNINHPLFGIILTFVSYEIGRWAYNKWKLPILNPILIAIVIIVSLLKGFSIDLKSYEVGGNMLSFFLAPVTVILAVPLYKQLDLLKKNFFPIIVGAFVGASTAIISVVVIGKLLNLEEVLLLSLAPKSITTPIGLEMSKIIGGILPITIVGIMITGITGAVLAPTICKVFKIRSGLARGIAIGASSHAVGTSKAIEMGEVEGAMSGLAIGLTGIATIVVLPIIIRILF